MSLKLSQNAAICSENTPISEKHILFVLNEKAENNHPFAEVLNHKLKRSQGEFKDLNKSPVICELPNGSMASFVILGETLSMFQKHTLLRKAVKPLLDEKPEALAIC
jgi:leucyl aminopeptidase